MSETTVTTKSSTKSFEDYQADAHMYQVAAANTRNDSTAQLAAAVMALTSTQLAQTAKMNELMEQFAPLSELMPMFVEHFKVAITEAIEESKARKEGIVD